MDIVNIMDSRQLQQARPRRGCVPGAAGLIQLRRGRSWRKTGPRRAQRAPFITGELVTRFGEFIRESKQ